MIDIGMQRAPLLAAALLQTFLAVAGGGEAEPARTQQSRTFRISIDRPMWRAWGFEYPVTYLFDVEGLSPGAVVRRRDPGDPDWRALPVQSVSNHFDGIECVRFDPGRNRAMVSAGFGRSSAFDLDFAGVAHARFASVARYYDDRAAAYSLSLDNWGRQATALPGAPWCGAADDRSDKYQAALDVCRGLRLPVSIAINSRMAGGDGMWAAMQRELDRRDSSWEPAVHARTHPGNARAYAVLGCRNEIIGCREDILGRLRPGDAGRHVLEHILTSGYCDAEILDTDAGGFLFVRGYNGRDNPDSSGWAPWDAVRGFYGVGGLSTKDYDRVLARRRPAGRFAAADVAELDAEFDRVRRAGGIFYALWHPDRYVNSVMHDPRPGVDGEQGSTLVQHLRHVAGRNDVWYVANGWLYSYRYVAEHATVAESQPMESAP